MVRSPEEVEKDLLKLQNDLKTLLEVEGSILMIDLTYFSNTRKDLLLELRLAKAGDG